MDEQTQKALKIDMIVDITTVGRRTGQPRRIEIWSHNLDGRVIITGYPGRRNWYANLLGQPEFTYHLKEEVQADLAATARPIREPEERRVIFTKLKNISRFRQEQGIDVERWMNGSALIGVTFSPGQVTVEKR